MVSYPPFSCVFNWAPELKKLNWDTRQTLTPIGLERASNGEPKQCNDRQQQGCRNCLRGCPGESYNTGSAFSAKNDVERIVICGELSCTIADGIP